MALDHFSARHFGARHFRTLFEAASAAAAAAFEWLITARRRGSR